MNGRLSAGRRVLRSGGDAHDSGRGGECDGGADRTRVRGLGIAGGFFANLALLVFVLGEDRHEIVRDGLVELCIANRSGDAG